MKKSIVLWIIAFLITVLFIAYQRITGPTYPISSKITINNNEIKYKLYRSHGGNSDHEIQINVPDKSISGTVFWKRYKTKDEFKRVDLLREGDFLIADLPNQPPAGKLEYRVYLKHNSEIYYLNNANSVVIRFKGDVPTWVLIPHIFTIFMAMFLSTRTGLQIFNKNKNLKKYVWSTILFLFVGGFIMGPLTQWYAFGAFWTGFPFGHDLTDNKTLIAMLGWLIALVMIRKSAKPERWTVFAAILLIAAYLIPHSVLGSELDYNKLDKEKHQVQKIEDQNIQTKNKLKPNSK